jgi:crossover junction endodeoxyribonuclease RuvC
MECVFSIDPSLSSTGYAVIEKTSRRILLCNRYTTKNDTDENTRIKNIVQRLSNIILYDGYDISEIAMEDGFVGASVKTGLSLCKLRGGIITYFMMNNIPVYTQLPSETRKNLGLKGNAKKEEVADEILRLYPELINTIGPYSDKSNKQKTSDMYDSVCIGISHLNKNGS